MNTQPKASWIIVLVLSLVLVACNSATPPPAQIIEITREVPVTVVVTQIVQLVVTATPPPATSTPEPTATPEPTTAPAFQKWTSSQVVEAFRAAGLEITGETVMTRDDYGLAPLSAVEATHFFIPSLCSDCGGRIFSFATQEDLDMMRNYYVSMGKASAALYSWVFVKDNIVVQINGDLPEEQARQYEATLNAMK